MSFRAQPEDENLCNVLYNAVFRKKEALCIHKQVVSAEIMLIADLWLHGPFSRVVVLSKTARARQVTSTLFDTAREAKRRPQPKDPKI